MLFNSFIFLALFLPIALTAYYAAGARSPRLAALWLCIASLVFYGAWAPAFVALLVASIAFNYGMSRAILAAAPGSMRGRLWLAAAIGVDIGVLVRYKYLAVMTSALVQWFGLSPHGMFAQASASVVLPLGVSFFTFTQIGYLLDCRARIVKRPDALGFVQFVTFFPHLIAGPILHHKEMMTQFAQAETYRLRAENISIGMSVFAMGLAKKLLLADSIAPYADAGFAAPSALGGWAAWGAALAYALQLYFDFSGYSDMAVGLAKMFGVRFPLNFNSPFKATSIIDFWQRWHMTLTRYLSAYLYYPLSMRINRWRAQRGLPIGRAAQASPQGFLATVAVPTVYTMGLAGIWHGAGLQYLIYGLLHAGYLVINHAWRNARARKSLTETTVPRQSVVTTRVRHLASVLTTFLATLMAFVFFRAHGVADACAMLKAMIGLHGFEPIAWPALHVDSNALSWLRLAMGRVMPAPYLALLLAIAWFAPNSHEWMGRFSPALERASEAAPMALRWSPSWRWTAAVVVVLLVCAAQLHGEVRFLYFQF